MFTARDGHLELPREVAVLAVLREEVGDGVDDRLRVERLVVGDARDRTAQDVPRRVATALDRRQPDLVVAVPDLRDVLDLDPVFLDVLPGRDIEVGVAPDVVLFLAAVFLRCGRVGGRHLADGLGLLGAEIAARDLRPHHVVVLVDAVGVHPGPLQALELPVVGLVDDLLEGQPLPRVLLDVLDHVERVFPLFPLLDRVHPLPPRCSCSLMGSLRRSPRPSLAPLKQPPLLYPRCDGEYRHSSALPENFAYSLRRFRPPLGRNPSTGGVRFRFGSGPARNPLVGNGRCFR